MKKKRTLGQSIAAAPHIVWAVMFILMPLFIVIYYAFTDADGAFSLENITALSDYAAIFALSIELSVIATFICRSSATRSRTSSRGQSRNIANCSSCS